MTDITQADRDAAKSYDPFLWEMKPRSREFQSLVQAFARHRMEATEALRAENERLREALQDIILDFESASILCREGDHTARAALGETE